MPYWGYTTDNAKCIQQIQIARDTVMGDTLWRSCRGNGKCDQLVFLWRYATLGKGSKAGQNLVRADGRDGRADGSVLC